MKVQVLTQIWSRYCGMTSNRHLMLKNSILQRRVGWNSPRDSKSLMTNKHFTFQTVSEHRDMDFGPICRFTFSLCCLLFSSTHRICLRLVTKTTMLRRFCAHLCFGPSFSWTERPNTDTCLVSSNCPGTSMSSKYKHYNKVPKPTASWILHSVPVKVPTALIANVKLLNLCKIFLPAVVGK